MMTAMRANGKPPADATLMGIVTAAAILLFVATGCGVALSAVERYLGQGAIDRSLLTAMLLNIAVILFGWRYHRHAIRAATDPANARAGALAVRDPLTGFFNRRSFAEEGATLFQRAARGGKAIAMLALDLDHLKTVNDLHGHVVGDALIREVAVELARLLPEGTPLARLGGDEFAALMLFDPARPETVERIAQRMIAFVSAPIPIDGLDLHIGGSVGLARSDFDCASIDALMRAADMALRGAKVAGRKCHAWFDPAMERAIQTRNALESGLRSAIPDGHIVPYFEQQIDLSTDAISGFEVLARWQHPTRGLIAPDQFIPIAEETGMIAELSLSIMHQAFAAARDWSPALTLSINISPSQLRDAWLAQKIIKALTETGFPASRLEIEITESSLFENLPLAQSIVGSLKNQGIRIALDDFGTGYSSLAHLRALPFDRIKIDKSFVSSLIGNAESAAIVNAITRLGDGLNLSITAEGIEDAATRDRIAALGCAKGQGYLFGRPLSIAETRRLLAERRLLAAYDAAPAAPPVRRVGG
jgi:diguanylate cyclase (GGDEF)-like protein